MEPLQEQTIQADIHQLSGEMNAVAAFRNRMQVTEAGNITGYSRVLMEMSELYRKFSENIGRYRGLLQEDMLQAETLLKELEEADERILY